MKSTSDISGRITDFRRDEYRDGIRYGVQEKSRTPEDEQTKDLMARLRAASEAQTGKTREARTRKHRRRVVGNVTMSVTSYADMWKQKTGNSPIFGLSDMQKIASVLRAAKIQARAMDEILDYALEHWNTMVSTVGWMKNVPSEPDMVFFGIHFRRFQEFFDTREEGAE